MNNYPTPATSIDLAARIAVVYTGLAAGDPVPLATALAPDVVLHVPGTHALAGTHHGADQLLSFLLATRELTDSGEQIELLDVLTGRDHAAALCRVTATRPGRASLDNHTVHLLRFAGDQIAEIWLHNRDDFAVNAFWS
jgi:ketosteroid isomerase-like protein